ncbi:hypothetical protein [Salinibaculum rarum]|uniref:hypothetical protein n=1 Tax=Salinibaculum rarum TaxID=3058903 RepID=UPI00265F874D|nr:hypothetical protein [Salinibaculum sp. KK48]
MSDADDDRTTIWATQATNESLEALKDEFNVLSKNATIQSLIQSHQSRTAAAPSDAEQPSLQPLSTSTLRQFIVFCPVCGSALAEFDFTDDTRISEGGVFEQASLPCVVCGDDNDWTFRYESELLAAASPDDFSESVAEEVLTEYWDDQLGDPRFSAPQNAETLAIWNRLAREASWDWLLPLSAWTYVSDLEDILREVSEYLDSQVGTQLTLKDGDDECDAETWHYHFSSEDTEEMRGNVNTRLSVWLSDCDVTPAQRAGENEIQKIVFDGVSQLTRAETASAPSQ